MEGLHSPVETFWGGGVFGDVHDFHPRLAEFFGRAACGKEVDIFGGEEFAKVNDASFVRYGDKGSRDGDDVLLGSCDMFVHEDKWVQK